MVSVKHAFVTTKPDGTDGTLVDATNWNADHAMTLAAARLVGRSAASAGAIEEISLDGTLQIVGTVLGINAAGLPASGALSTTTITAGGGLSGGGSLAADRSFSMLAPLSLNAFTVNSITGGHTHGIDSVSLVATGYPAVSHTGIGAVILGCFYAGSPVTGIPGYPVSGSSLYFASGTTGQAQVNVGTWRAMGYFQGAAGNIGPANITAWVRVS